MENTYKTRATYVWSDRLIYHDSHYQFYVSFSYGNWGEPNDVILIFDEKGEYVESEAYINYKFRKSTEEETKEDHLNYAMKYKEKVQRLIKHLIKSGKKENIIFENERNATNEEYLHLFFTLDKVDYGYKISTRTPYANRLDCWFEDNSETLRVTLWHNIPSLMGIRDYIRNHPKIRVKYVNELAHYNKIKQEMEKKSNQNLDHW